MANPYFNNLPDFLYVNRTKDGRSEGDYSIVKNFFKYYAKKVNKLKRISIGCINLGELETGKTSKLDYNEVMNLKKQIQIKES